MKASQSCSVLKTTLVLCLLSSEVHCRCERLTYELSSRGKPLLKRPNEHTYKTVLSLDIGALAGVVTVMVLIEVEQSIKQYLLDHSECLPEGLKISSLDDFDINLVDYFDCITGVSAGGWSAAYLASRGGQGASRAVLDDPAIIEKYGLIPTGAAAGLRVFYNEYGSTIYPAHTIDTNAGVPLDLMNPLAPGSTSPLYSLNGLERSLEAFLGNTTLADADTSLLIPTVDLGTGLTVYFVQNAFKDPPVTSSARLIARVGPRSFPVEGESLLPDIAFDEGKDYYLKDVATATGTSTRIHPAKAMAQAGSQTTEYLLKDGGVVVENTDFFGALFVSSETRMFGFDKIAILSIGTGLPLANLTSLRNTGNIQWSQDYTSLRITSVLHLWPALMNYLYYANPATKPFQYLRINGLSVILGDETSGSSLNPNAVPQWEERGALLAKANRQSIDIFVKDFIFA